MSKGERTRGRIVARAAEMFRERGIHGAGVDQVMAAAGLTPGGFYAHFEDKTELVARALEMAFDEGFTTLFEDPQKGAGWAAYAARKYLSMDHRDDAAHGCAVPSLSAEVARSDRSVRRAYTQNIRELIDRTTRKLGRGKAARKRAISMLSAWIGAMLVARAVDDEALASEIFEATGGKRKRTKRA